jgi:steroid 5-alpha reductase family enzyme
MPDQLLTAWGPVPAGVGLGFLLCLVASSPGFFRLVYFISTGYAFSIAALAGMAGGLYRDALSPLLAAQLVLLALYGLRLGVFLIGRERSPTYRRELADIQRRAVGINRPVQLVIWMGVSALYVAMFFPALTNLAASARGDTSIGTLPYGVALMIVGLALEAWADQQKNAFKREQPDRFCDVGLYRVVRCPNYFGEMVFWLGQLVAGLAHFSHWSHWLASGVGFVCIQLIMVGSTRRLELKQDERYGARADYRSYVERVPVLIPLVPIFSVKNAKVYLG